MLRTLGIAIFSAVVIHAGIASAQTPVAPPVDLEAEYKKMDLDHDGIVTVIDYVGKKKHGEAAKAKSHFAKMDKNRDGFLMFKEYKAFMERPVSPKKN